MVRERASKTVPPDMVPQPAPILKFFFAWFQATALNMVHQRASQSKFTHFGGGRPAEQAHRGTIFGVCKSFSRDGRGQLGLRALASAKGLDKNSVKLLSVYQEGASFQKPWAMLSAATSDNGSRFDSYKTNKRVQ